MRRSSIRSFCEKTLAFVAVAAVVFFVFSVHRGSWRYVSIPEFLTIIKVSVTAVVVYTFGSFLLSRGTNVPRSVPVLAGMYLIAGLAGPRLAYRLFVEGSILPTSVLKDTGRAVRNVLLLGMTDSAESFIRLTRRGSLAGVNVVGVLDKSPRRHARSVQGVKVYGALPDLEAVVNRLARKGIKVSRTRRYRDVARPAAARPYRRTGDEPRPQGVAGFPT